MTDCDDYNNPLTDLLRHCVNADWVSEPELCMAELTAVQVELAPVD